MGVFEFLTSITAMALAAITLWIIILRKDRRQAQSIEPEGDYQLSELSSMANSMRERIDNLESILDAEVPDWREQNERREDPHAS